MDGRTGRRTAGRADGRTAGQASCRSDRWTDSRADTGTETWPARLDGRVTSTAGRMRAGRPTCAWPARLRHTAKGAASHGQQGAPSGRARRRERRREEEVCVWFITKRLSGEERKPQFTQPRCSVRCAVGAKAPHAITSRDLALPGTSPGPNLLFPPSVPHG